jgi:hypothetical protein
MSKASHARMLNVCLTLGVQLFKLNLAPIWDEVGRDGMLREGVEGHRVNLEIGKRQNLKGRKMKADLARQVRLMPKNPWKPFSVATVYIS